MFQPFTHSKRPALWVLVFFMVSIGLVCCTRKQSDSDNKPPCEAPRIDESRYPIAWNSATIQLSSILTDQQLIDSLMKGAKQIPGNTLTPNKIKIRHCPCDPALVNITLVGSYTINGVGDPATVQTGTTGTTGDFGLPFGSVVAVNYKLDSFDTLKAGVEQGGNPPASENEYPGRSIKLPTPTPGSKTVRIGIYDTGLEAARYLPGTDWEYPTQTCSRSGVLNPRPTQPGYSFVENAGAPLNYTDDNNFRHGSRVAYLLARQFEGSSVVPKIIPFKVLDKNNQGDLFALLCALETGRLNGVQVYNLSLGYYGEAQPLLRTYIQRILANPNAYIVAATGNRPEGDTAMNHNADSMFPKFYPAAFAPEFNRLLTVTTVQRPPLSTVEASKRQNYSPKWAWGVAADLSENGTDRFILTTDGKSLTGSSFATPILAGRLARWLGESSGSPIKNLYYGMNAGIAPATGKQVQGNRYLPSHP